MKHSKKSSQAYCYDNYKEIAYNTVIATLSAVGLVSSALKIKNSIEVKYDHFNSIGEGFFYYVFIFSLVMMILSIKCILDSLKSS